MVDGHNYGYFRESVKETATKFSLTTETKYNKTPTKIPVLIA